MTQMNKRRHLGLLYIAAAMALSGCTGVLQSSGGASRYALKLNNDASNPARYAWQNATLVKGNKNIIPLTGECGKAIAEVQIFVDGAIATTVPCANGVFTANLSDPNIFPQNRSYGLSLVGVTKSQAQAGRVEPLARTYSFRKVDPNSLLKVSPTPPASTNLDTAHIEGICEPGVNITIGAIPTFRCSGAGNFDETVSLAMGVNVAMVSWVDDWGNGSTENFFITRNDPLAPLLTVGSVSFVPSNITVASVNDGKINATSGGGGEYIAQSAGLAMGSAAIPAGHTIAGNQNTYLALTPPVPMSFLDTLGSSSALASGNLSLNYCYYVDVNGLCCKWNERLNAVNQCVPD